jgi:hypothetical protein
MNQPGFNPAINACLGTKDVSESELMNLRVNDPTLAVTLLTLMSREFRRTLLLLMLLFATAAVSVGQPGAGDNNRPGFAGKS